MSLVGMSLREARVKAGDAGRTVISATRIGTAVLPKAIIGYEWLGLAVVRVVVGQAASERVCTNALSKNKTKVSK